MVTVLENSLFIAAVVIMLTLLVWMLWLCKPQWHCRARRVGDGDTELREGHLREDSDSSPTEPVVVPPPEAMVDWRDLQRSRRE